MVMGINQLFLLIILLIGPVLYYFIFRLVLRQLKIHRKESQSQELQKQKHQSNEQDKTLKFMAYHDQLTGLPNRRCFQEKMIEGLGAARPKGAVLLMGIDNFRAVNEVYGHTFGDGVIIELSHRLSETLKEVFIAYMGGDEFAVIVENHEKITKVAEAILNIFLVPLGTHHNELSLSASVGIATYPQDGLDVETLLSNAEVALHYAKNRGGKGLVFYRGEMGQFSVKKLGMEMHLKNALKKDEMRVVYQPQFSVADGKLIGFEALLRWDNPLYEGISPLQYIHEAEERGIIQEIGEWVLSESFDFAKQMNRGVEAPLRISINISPIQLMQIDFVQTFKRLLRKTETPTEIIGIEITETALISPFTSNVRKIAELKDLGISVSLDDFGTGYSSLSYLRNLPVSMVKIDKSFLDGMMDDVKNLKLIKAMIDISHDFELQVLAEGVESEAQLERLNTLGCEYAQGFWLGKPVPMAQALQEYGHRRESIK